MQTHSGCPVTPLPATPGKAVARSAGTAPLFHAASPHRRTVLKSALALGMVSGLPACDRIMTPAAAPLPPASVDVHAHVFNGRDVPVVGFLQQTILRDPHGPVDPSLGSTALLSLLKGILLSGTPTARAELRRLRDRGFEALSPDRLADQDQSAVARGLAGFAADRGVDAAGLRVPDADRADLLEQIASELGRGGGMAQRLQDPDAQARALAAEIYRRDGEAGLAGTSARGFVHNSPLILTIRWAGLLTRARIDILDELVRLYGGPGRIQVFLPTLVDFGRWFTTQEQVTPIDLQIDLLSLIAKNRNDALILPFVSFCPLRAALEREDDPDLDPLRHARRAVAEMGFCGVKLYPPMGFRPIGNDTALDWVPRRPIGGGAALDRELDGLYRWCAANGVPITAHANNSIAAGPDTGTFADPAGWRAVLDQPAFAGLRLNLAHFGGFDETMPGTALSGGTDWEDTIADMVARHPTLYVDLGYWMEAAGPSSPNRDRVMARLRAMLDRTPLLTRRMMYGSDWTMIGREPGHASYPADLHAALATDLGLSRTQRDAVMGGNALRFLGLAANGPQRDRVAAFFASNPVFEAIFPS